MQECTDKLFLVDFVCIYKRQNINKLCLNHVAIRRNIGAQLSFI